MRGYFDTTPENIAEASESFRDSLVGIFCAHHNRLEELEDLDFNEVKTNVENHEERLSELEGLDLEMNMVRLDERVDELEQSETVPVEEFSYLQDRVTELESQLAGLAPALAALDALRAALAPAPAEPEVRVEYVEVPVKPTTEELASLRMSEVLQNSEEWGFVNIPYCTLCQDALTIAGKVNAAEAAWANVDIEGVRDELVAALSGSDY